jgi:hypothetical protein
MKVMILLRYQLPSLPEGGLSGSLHHDSDHTPDDHSLSKSKSGPKQSGSARRCSISAVSSPVSRRGAYLQPRGSVYSGTVYPGEITREKSYGQAYRNLFSGY